VATVSADLRIAIQQARMAKGLNQKQLAQLVSEQVPVIQAYESGKAVPNGQIIAKLERALGVRLPRPAKK
jgi:putative transcription factor